MPTVMRSPMVTNPTVTNSPAPRPKGPNSWAPAVLLACIGLLTWFGGITGRGGVTGLGPAAARADGWRAAGANTFHSGSPYLYSVITSDLGVFVLQTAREIPLQLFNPKEIKEEDALSIFLEFNPTSKSFTRLVSPHGEYPIRGGFDLTLGAQAQLTVSVDGNNPYLSFTVPEPDAPSKVRILSTLGSAVVVNKTVPKQLAEFLQGNSAFSEYRKEGLVKTYHYTSAGMTLAGKPIPPGSILGMAPPAATRVHPCLKNDAVILSVADLQRLQALNKTDKKKATRFLTQKIAQSRSPSFFKSLLILTVKDHVVGLDVVSASLQLVRPLKKDSTSRFPVCVAEDIPVG